MPCNAREPTIERLRSGAEGPRGVWSLSRDDAPAKRLDLPAGRFRRRARERLGARPGRFRRSCRRGRGAGRGRGGRPRRSGRHARPRQHPSPPVPDADARPGAGGNAVRVAARAVPRMGADRSGVRVCGRPDRARGARAVGLHDGLRPPLRVSARPVGALGGRGAGGTGARPADRRRSRVDGPRGLGRRTATGLPRRVDRRDPRRHGAARRAPGRGRNGAARGRALLAVLGHEGADAGIGGARA